MAQRYAGLEQADRVDLYNGGILLQRCLVVISKKRASDRKDDLIYVYQLQSVFLKKQAVSKKKLAGVNYNWRYRTNCLGSQVSSDFI